VNRIRGTRKNHHQKAISFRASSEKTIRWRKDNQMDIDITPYACSASVLAKSLLEVWLSHDGSRLRDELDYLSCMPDLPEIDDESDRVDLLKGIASRMRESSDISASQPDDAAIGTWLSLLHHLSVSRAPAEVPANDVRWLGASAKRAGTISAI
jgi:hypothetical protein